MVDGICRSRGGPAAGGVAALTRCAGVRTSHSSSELSEDDGERDGLSILTLLNITSLS